MALAMVLVIALAGCGASSTERDPDIGRDAAAADAALPIDAAADAALPIDAAADAALPVDAALSVDASDPRCEGVDCSVLDDACHVGVCDPVDGSCHAVAVVDDTPCDDGDGCTSADVCAAGVCVGTLECPSALTFMAAADTALRGGEGGAPAVDDCPEGQVLVGLDVRFDLWLTRLAAVCGTPSVEGTPDALVVTIGPGDTLPERGLEGGALASPRCPPDQAVVGFAGRSALLVDALELRCAPLDVTGLGAGSFSVAPGAVTTQPLVGGSGGEAFGATDCTAGAIATGVNLRHANAVDAFGLRCSTLGAR